MPDAIYLGTTMTVDIDRLRDEETNLGLVLADVVSITCALYEATRTTVVTGAGTLAVTNPSTTPLVYRARVPSTLTLTLGATYWLRVVATLTGSRVVTAWQECIAEHYTA